MGVENKDEIADNVEINATIAPITALKQAAKTLGPKRPGAEMTWGSKRRRHSVHNLRSTGKKKISSFFRQFQPISTEITR